MKKKLEFASGIDYYKLFWVFLIGCFLGVFVESLYCLVTNGYIQSRQGVIYGPFNPVYGFGAVFLTVLLQPFSHKKWIIIFIFSMLLGGSFEFLSSLIQQQMTGTVSWQYHRLPFNIGGRTSLMYSFFWGCLGVIWVKELYPNISAVIEKIPRKFGIPLTWILTVFMILNMTISVLAVDRWNQRLKDASEKGPVDEFLDTMYPDDYLKKVYPNMVHLGK